MYTTGHVAILLAAMKQLPEAFFTEDKLSGEYELIKALSYPDFPCGTIRVQDGVLHENMKSCGIFRLGIAMIMDRMSMGHQSHNGFYSLWHAMTYDPDKNVENVARNICEYVLICCNLAHSKKSFFWLGFALHIVMDAYSPAHTLREGTFADDAELLRRIAEYDGRLHGAAKHDVVKIRDAIKMVVSSVLSGNKYEDIVHDTSTILGGGSVGRDMAAFILFDHLERKKLPFRPKMTGTRTKTTRRIMNFYYYPQQTHLFHYSKDRIGMVKKYKLYDECIYDVAVMLQLYRDHEQDEDSQAYLHKVHKLMASRTLKVHNKCLTADTGYKIPKHLQVRTKHIVV
jgi:hypothetical protein